MLHKLNLEGIIILPCNVAVRFTMARFLPVPGMP